MRSCTYLKFCMYIQYVMPCPYVIFSTDMLSNICGNRCYVQFMRVREDVSHFCARESVREGGSTEQIN